jgi:hypothetical protein
MKTWNHFEVELTQKDFSVSVNNAPPVVVDKALLRKICFGGLYVAPLWPQSMNRASDIRLKLDTLIIEAKSEQPSHAIDENRPIVGALETMFPRLAIGRAVVPLLGRCHRRKLEDHNALRLRPLQHLLSAIGGKHLYRVTLQGAAGFARIDLKRYRIAGHLTNEYGVCSHCLFSFFGRVSPCYASAHLIRNAELTPSNIRLQVSLE